MFLGMGFVVAQTPFYNDFYHASGVGDQQLGGAIMTVVDIATLLIVLTAVFWRSARDDDAKAVVDEADAERELRDVEDKPHGVRVAQVRQ